MSLLLFVCGWSLGALWATYRCRSKMPRFRAAVEEPSHVRVLGGKPANVGPEERSPWPPPIKPRPYDQDADQ